MIKITTDYFQLDQIADSGQCFRMNPLPEGGYSVISCGRFLKISQEGNSVFFDCPEDDLSYWYEYFDFNTDYGQMAASVLPDDLYLKQAAAFGQGIRILKQDPWEMIITFIISQQKTIPKIKEAVEQLSMHYGKKKKVQGCTFYSFPTPEELSSASLQDLLDLKLGYRAKYIYRTCRDARDGVLDLSSLSSMDYEEAMEYLSRFYGIGRKVANCICLFGLHHIDAFPVDTWIQKILQREYYLKKYDKLPKCKVYDTIIQEHFGRYRGYAGVMQQYIFYYERNRQN